VPRQRLEKLFGHPSLIDGKIRMACVCVFGFSAIKSNPVLMQSAAAGVSDWKVLFLFLFLARTCSSYSHSYSHSFSYSYAY
jgi:hypothetical protein